MASLVIITAALVAAVPGGPIAAGGWAVTVVDPLPTVVAGAPLEVSFTILQHGQTPVDVEDVLLIVTEPDGDRRQFPARPAGEVGRYRATVELADPGEHGWQVVQGWFGAQDLGRLEVGAPLGPVAAAVASTEVPTVPVVTVAAAASLAGVAGALAVTGRRRRLRRV
jgi:hypothetical protein